MATYPIESTEYPTIAASINETYPDRIDHILSAAIVDNPAYSEADLVVIAQDGPKQLLFIINETRPDGETFQSRILNPDVIEDDANFAEYSLDDRDDIDVLADRIRSTDPLRPWLAKIAAQIDAQGSLASFADSIPSLWDELDSKAFNTALSEALTIASMAGYFEAGTDAQ